MKDNHSLVASDFYTEQSEHAYSLEGSPEDPEGRLTLQAPKVHMGQQSGDPSRTVFDIRGYHGQVFDGPAQLYIAPTAMNVMHTGTRPLDFVLWASFFYNTELVVKKDDTARVSLIGCTGISNETHFSHAEQELPSDSLQKLATALDDLRALGELELRLNHPDVKRTLEIN